MLTEGNKDDEQLSDDTTDEEMVKEPTNEDIRESIGKLVNGKAPGKEGINVELTQPEGDGL